MPGLCLSEASLLLVRGGGFGLGVYRDDAILAVSLRLVERLAARGDELLATFEPALHRDYEARGRTHFAAVGRLAGRRLEVDPQALGELRRPDEIGFRRQQSELLAAVARRQVDLPGARIENRADAPEDGVAGLVAVSVVDALEIVEIDQQRRQRVAHPLGAPPFERELVVEGASVGQAGQRIGCGLGGNPAEVSDRVEDWSGEGKRDEHEQSEGAERRVEDPVLVRLDAGVDGLLGAEREQADSNRIGNPREQAAVTLFAYLNRVPVQLDMLAASDDRPLAHDQEAGGPFVRFFL